MIKYHTLPDGRILAEILPGSVLLSGPEDMLDLMAETAGNGSDFLAIHKESLPEDFFDLKTGIAGEILQKFSNYRMKLAIIGDFSAFTSRSLKAFITESNRGNTIKFAGSFDELLNGSNFKNLS